MKQLIFYLVMIVVGIGAMNAQEADVLKSDAIMQEGQMYYQKAADLYELAGNKYVEEGNIDAFCFYKAGQNQVKVKNYNKAIEMLEKARTNGFNEVDLYLVYGDAYTGLKQFDKAEVELIDGKEKYPENSADFTKKLGYLYFNSAQYDKAIDYLSKAIEQEPNNYNYHYLLGSSYERSKKYKEATVALEKVLELKPSHKNSIKKLGVIYFRQTDYLYTKETKRYESMKNPTRVDYHNSTKKLEQIAQGYSKSLPYLEKAHSNSPNDKAIINCLNVAYRRLKMNDKAASMEKLL